MPSGGLAISCGVLYEKANLKFALTGIVDERGVRLATYAYDGNSRPSGFTVYYIWADHLGTPRMITDSTNQSRWEWAQ